MTFAVERLWWDWNEALGAWLWCGVDRICPQPDRNGAAHRVMIALFAGFVTFVLHAATAWRYGYFRDELYFIACAHTWRGATSINRRS